MYIPHVILQPKHCKHIHINIKKSLCNCIMVFLNIYLILERVVLELFILEILNLTINKIKLLSLYFFFGGGCVIHVYYVKNGIKIESKLGGYVF